MTPSGVRCSPRHACISTFRFYLLTQTSLPFPEATRLTVVPSIVLAFATLASQQAHTQVVLELSRHTIPLLRVCSYNSVMRFTASLLAFFTLLALAALDGVDAKKKILIYTYAQAYYHESIPVATKTVQRLGEKSSPGFDSVHSNDPADFEKSGWLKQFDALVFLSISGKALSKTGSGNLRRYIEAGGGYVGIHVSCDALTDHPWYGRLVGAFFHYHPQLTHATLNVVDHKHPSTAHLNKTWHVYDEIYSFKSDPSKYGKQYVLTARESSYDDPIESREQRASEQGSPHPIAWWKEGGQLDYDPHVKVGGGTDPTKQQIRDGTAGTGGAGRSFYTSLGHTKSVWAKEDFQMHILGAIEWVLESPSLRSNNASASKLAVGSALTSTSDDNTRAPATDSSLRKTEIAASSSLSSARLASASIWLGVLLLSLITLFA